MQEVIHDATQSLSGHHPIVTKIAMNLPAYLQWKRSSYLKMNVEELKVDEMRETIKRVWKEKCRKAETHGSIGS